MTSTSPGLGQVDGLHGLGPVAGVGAHGQGAAGGLDARHEADQAREHAAAVHRVGDVGRRGLEVGLADLLGPVAAELGGGLRAALLQRGHDGSRRGRGVGGLGDRAADHDDVGARAGGGRGRLAVDAAGHEHGQAHRLAHARQRREGILPEHLLVDAAVHVDRRRAELLGRARGRHRVGPR
jgi:hypothetical protein